MSTQIKDGGLAFPYRETESTGQYQHHYGMTLRDYFAGQALSGILASANFGSTKDWIGGKAYEAADAMLAERKEVTK